MKVKNIIRLTLWAGPFFLKLDCWEPSFSFLIWKKKLTVITINDINKNNNNRWWRRIINSVKNNVLIVSIFNIVHFHFLAAVFCDLLYYFSSSLMYYFFCTRDSAADRDPAKMVPWIVRDVVGASNQSLCERHTHTNTLSPPTGSRFTSTSILVYLPAAWSNWTN